MKIILRPLIFTLILLLIPFFVNHRADGFNWTGGDFLFMGAIIFIAISLYEYISRKSNAPAYKAGVALASLTGFLIVWVTLAVGIIGDDNPGNILYLLVLGTALFGSIATGFNSVKLPRVMYATAIIQIIIPLVVYIFWPGDFSPGFVPVFGINIVLAILWIGSGLLFRRASRS